MVLFCGFTEKCYFCNVFEGIYALRAQVSNLAEAAGGSPSLSPKRKEAYIILLVKKLAYSYLFKTN